MAVELPPTCAASSPDTDPNANYYVADLHGDILRQILAKSET